MRFRGIVRPGGRHGGGRGGDGEDEDGVGKLHGGSEDWVGKKKNTKWKIIELGSELKNVNAVDEEGGESEVTGSGIYT